ncbi:MAG TPA: phytanoyl-CoA dioxygenase family protein [Pyrinomonadaceae bacterium]|nr:phytanoyl-CoA dioxygenase family protein [Pyrinomonadaceae bacterium]
MRPADVLSQVTSPAALQQVRQLSANQFEDCRAEISREYHEHVERPTGQYERQLFLAKKGDVFLWHGMTLHGGSEIENPQLTRKSFVIHYMPKSMNVSGKIVGPFNW